MKLLKRSTLQQRIRTGTHLLVRNHRLLLRKASVVLRRGLISSGHARDMIKMGQVIFPFDYHWGPQMETMYYGGYEPESAVLVEKLLSRGMSFVDVGANVGYFSALALARV